MEGSQGDPGEGWTWALLARWVAGVGLGKDDQAGFSGSRAAGAWREQVHIKGVMLPAAGRAPPFPAQPGFAL